MAKTTTKVTLSLDNETYQQFKEYAKQNSLSISSWVSNKMASELNTRYYVIESSEPFIMQEKIFETIEDAVLKASKSQDFAGVVQGNLVWMD